MEDMKSKLTVLVIDDTPTNIDVVKGVLSDTYFVQAAINGKTGLNIIRKKKPDLILLDIMMPEMDGYEVCRTIQDDPEINDIPIIFLTAKSAVEDEAKGLALGAVDYITKPLSPAILKERVKNHLELKIARDLLREQNEILEQKVIERTRQISELQDGTITAMGALAETRDPETGNHIKRTQLYVKVLAQKLKSNPKFSSFLTPENITLLFKTAPLHDIGKVGIPDNILLKPGKLDEEEFEIMKKHTVYGKDTIDQVELITGQNNVFLNFAKEISLSHHEKWDGSGYPRGLKGEEIPLSARLMAIADVYDALISKRVYKPPFSHKEAVDIIIKGRGTHFDPEIVDNFLEIDEEFYEIAKQFID